MESGASTVTLTVCVDMLAAHLTVQGTGARASLATLSAVSNISVLADVSVDCSLSRARKRCCPSVSEQTVT